MKRFIGRAIFMLIFGSGSYTSALQSQSVLSTVDPYEEIQDRENARGDREKADEIMALFGYPTSKDLMEKEKKTKLGEQPEEAQEAENLE